MSLRYVPFSIWKRLYFIMKYRFVYLFKSTITFSFPLMKISGPNVKLPHWVLKKLDKFTYYPNWKYINRNIWTVELWKICLCFRENNSIMEENFFQWNVPNLWKKAVLIFATLQDFFGLSSTLPHSADLDRAKKKFY